MKKTDNIDILFARKISNLEKTPSPGLWQRIEQGQKKETRRLGSWLWYAAASVTVLLTAGYFVWQNQSLRFEPKGRMAQTEQVINPKEEKLDSHAWRPGETKDLASVQETKPAKSNNQSRSMRVETLATIIKAAAPTQQETEQIPILGGIEIAKVEKATVNPEQLLAKTEEAKSLQTVDVQVPGTLLAALSQKRVIVAHVEMETFDKENPEPPKFIRIMRQLKNAKQGDEVEWDKLGFNPKRILARADERLRNGEEKISDKYQELKNKTKL